VVSSSGSRWPGAFVNRPLILLADEPTGNLDPDTSIEIMRLLDRINRTGTTVVMVTHDSNIVNQMRRRVVEIEGGKNRPRPAAGCVRLTPPCLPESRVAQSLGPPNTPREGTPTHAFQVRPVRGSDRASGATSR